MNGECLHFIIMGVVELHERRHARHDNLSVTAISNAHRHIQDLCDFLLTIVLEHEMMASGQRLGD